MSYNLWDWETGTQRAVARLEGFVTRLDHHIAERTVND